MARKYFKIIGIFTIIIWAILLIAYLFGGYPMIKMVSGIDSDNFTTWIFILILIPILVIGPAIGAFLISYSNHLKQHEDQCIENKKNNN